MREINSSDNKYIKLANSLKTKKYRDKYALFFDEGIKNIELSLKSNYVLKYVFLREDFKHDYLIEEIRKKIDKDNIFCLKENLFTKISDTVNSQGILAIYEKKEFEFDDISSVLVLDKLQDPGNIGTILRTSEAMGIDSIYYIKGTADFFSPKLVRASMGSIYFMKIKLLKDIDYLKAKGYKIYASCLDNAVSATNSFTDDKIALIIGNESNGVSDELIDKSDKKIKIKIKGKAQSLNVAVATSMLLYEMIRNK